jgi:hypothetical protein
MDRIETLARFAGWEGEYACKGEYRHGICLISVEDLPQAITRRHFVINKLALYYDPIAYQCMEEWLNEKAESDSTIEMYYYCSFIKSHSTLASCPDFS